jgi:hypothetical protein
MRNVEALRRQADAAGEVIGRYAAALLDSPLPWTRMRRVYALLGLVRRYGPPRVIEVCTIALDADMLDIHRLKRMLEQGVAPPPSTPVARRESLAVTLRVQKARLDPAMRLEAWDATAKVTFDRALLNELASLRFLDAHAHVTVVGPVGVGKTFLAHALGHIACRRGASVLAGRPTKCSRA